MTLLSNSLKAMLVHLPATEHEGVSARFHQQAPVLLDHLQRLYGHHAHFPTWFTALTVALAKALQTRPQALRQLDRQRSADKDWFCSERMLGYCTYVDRFAGDLRGVAEKIPHLEEMGVHYLHLLPFLRARIGENDGGFAVSSFKDIEPRFGTMTDLRELTDRLRQSGISLCSDFILNHVADDHPWALAAKAGDETYRDYFYSYPDRILPDQFEQSLGQIFPQAAPGNFTFVDVLQRWVWTTFYPYQWDLNYSNPAVFSEMATALLHLANQGIEVFRLDSTAFLWKREGSNCMNQPEAHVILQALRCLIEIAAPGVLLKAEAIVPTAQLPAYLGSGTTNRDDNSTVPVKECHLAYHSSLMAAAWVALAEQDAGIIGHVMRGTPPLPEQASWLTYVRCHDDIGWNVLRQEAALGGDDGDGGEQRLSRVAQFFAGQEDSYARGASFQAADPAAVHGTVGMSAALCGFSSAKTEAQTELARHRMLLLYGLALTFGGLPVIYMGDELAQGNDETYRLDPAKVNDSRWLQRPDFDLDAFALRHDAGTLPGQMFSSLCRMLTCRRTHPQLAATGKRHWIFSPHAELLIFARGDIEQANVLYFVGNFSEHPVALDLRILGKSLPLQPGWMDILSGQTFLPEAGPAPLLPACSQLWLIPYFQGVLS